MNPAAAASWGLAVLSAAAHCPPWVAAVLIVMGVVLTALLHNRKDFS